MTDENLDSHDTVGPNGLGKSMLGNTTGKKFPMVGEKEGTRVTNSA